MGGSQGCGRSPAIPRLTTGRRGVRHPEDDGVFVIDTATGQKQLLVSFAQLAKVLRPARPDVDEKELFINHTLWNRDGDRLFFLCAGRFRRPAAADQPAVCHRCGRHAG